MKKMMAIVFACLLAMTAFSASSFAEESKPLKIVCTTFPQYDWVREILGDMTDGVSLSLLLDNGVDLHNYQPTAADIVTISTSDLFIFVGGDSDEWVHDVLAVTQNPNLKAISMLKSVEAKAEETVEGMQDDEHDHDHGHESYDEHVWLSLRNAQGITQSICDALCELRPDRAAVYRDNAGAYAAKLADLDARYQAVVDAAPRSTVLFADRFPFRYLMDDYGLDYYAAFAGCSAETEASFETIAFLVGKVNELSLPAVLVIEGANRSIAETVVSNAQSKDQKILAMNSLQSMTATGIAEGATYLRLMEENLAVLQEALN